MVFVSLHMHSARHTGRTIERAEGWGTANSKGLSSLNSGPLVRCLLGKWPWTRPGGWPDLSAKPQLGMPASLTSFMGAWGTGRLCQQRPRSLWEAAGTPSQDKAQAEARHTAPFPTPS